MLIEPALDELVVKGNVALLWIIPGGFFCAAVIKGFSNYFQTIFMQKVGLRMIVMMQDQMFFRSAARFLENLAKYRAGEPVAPIFDPKLGY